MNARVAGILPPPLASTAQLHAYLHTLADYMAARPFYAVDKVLRSARIDAPWEVGYDAEELLFAAGLDLNALCDATQTDLVVTLADQLRPPPAVLRRDTVPSALVSGVVEVSP